MVEYRHVPCRVHVRAIRPLDPILGHMIPVDIATPYPLRVILTLSTFCTWFCYFQGFELNFFFVPHLYSECHICYPSPPLWYHYHKATGFSINYESLFEVRSDFLKLLCNNSNFSAKNKHLLKMKEKYFLSTTMFIVLWGPSL